MKNIVFTVPVEGPSLNKMVSLVSCQLTWIVTLNPEMLLAARYDPSYAKTIRTADVRAVDGFGLWACLRLTGRRTARVTGGQLVDRLLVEANQREWRVAVIGGAEGAAIQAVDRMHKLYPKVTFHAEPGGHVFIDGSEDEVTSRARERLVTFDPQILFVAFGHPKQERWIELHRRDYPSLRCVIGVGGVIDVWAGMVKPSPRWMRQMGLEWLWRVAQEPRRVRRIVNAVLVFPWRFFTER